MKYVVVTGGVVSGLGKGITSSSIGVLLQGLGLAVTAIKIDPYLNTDAGTMSPFEHGEVYVLDDGGEVDLDLGNYERFLGVTLTRDHNITTGKIYSHVIQQERKGEYLGKTVQVVPHVTDAIQKWIERVSLLPVGPSTKEPEVCLIELGGTVGDIESMVFLKALSQLPRKDVCLVHVSLVPEVNTQQKTKPTQHGVRELLREGLVPDVIVCRSAKPLGPSVKTKIAQACNVPTDHVVSIYDVASIYHVPLIVLEQKLHECIMGCLALQATAADPLVAWRPLAPGTPATTTVTIAIVGKYTGLKDSYLSVCQALWHAALEMGVGLNLEWVDSESIGGDLGWAKTVDGILVPGGFGSRGVEGMISAVSWARTNGKPYLGICLGLQVAVIEWCRNVLGLADAHSTEFSPKTPEPVVVEMLEREEDEKRGRMRLGARWTTLGSESLAAGLYKDQDKIKERHRHIYEVNPKYIEAIQATGLRFTGTSESRMEIVELPSHPFFFATQFHPEFQSRPLNPSPPFRGFVQAAAQKKI